jgi:hypothetical protein
MVIVMVEWVVLKRGTEAAKGQPSNHFTKSGAFNRA